MKTPSILMLVCATLCSAAAGDSLTNRPAKWATPMKVEGVPNLHKVDGTLYRSAQPTEKGMQELRKMGIKTVINLRSFHSDKDEVGSTAVASEHIPMKAWHPELEDARRFLEIVADPKRQPVLVHCQHGADRTGTLCAIYRIVVQGWAKEEAVREMREGGYGFHEVWTNLPVWIDGLKIEDLRKEEKPK